MIKQKKTITGVSLMLLALGGLQAQEGTTSAGGEATGTGGTSSYSVGQVVYTSNTGTGGSVSQGIQQPFEIYLVTGLEETAIHLKMKVYPNPTADFLRLEVEDKPLDFLEYQLYNLQGKLLATQKLTETKTTISMEEFPKAIYLLSVMEKNQIVKSYRIIKN